MAQYVSQEKVVLMVENVLRLDKRKQFQTFGESITAVNYKTFDSRKLKINLSSLPEAVRIKAIS